jgi:hypothetical protein
MSEKALAILQGVKLITVEATQEAAPQRITEIQLDAIKAERMIAQVLRDDQRMLPEVANKVAATICRRLLSSTPAPVNQALQGRRIIGPAPPHSFADSLGGIIDSEVDGSLASKVWELVFERGKELPSSIADPVRRGTFWKQS